MNLVATDLILGGIMPLAVYSQVVEITGELTPTLYGIFYCLHGKLIECCCVVNKSGTRCKLVSIFVWLASALFPNAYFRIGAVNYYMLFAGVVILTSLAVMLFV